MKPVYIKIPFKGKEYDFAGFRCPECGAEFLSDHEVNLSMKRVYNLG